MTISKVKAFAMAGALAFTPMLASCSDDDKGTGDVGVIYYDDRGVVVMNNANGYPNISIKCRNGEAFFVTKDENGGQRFQFEPDSPQCDGDKVILLETDKRTDKPGDPRVATNRPGSETQTPTTERQVQPEGQTTTTLELEN